MKCFIDGCLAKVTQYIGQYHTCCEHADVAVFERDRFRDDSEKDDHEDYYPEGKGEEE